MKHPEKETHMTTSIETYIASLKRGPSAIDFAQTLAVIDAHYCFAPTSFKNGGVVNAAGENSGSCKVFSFAQLHQLSQDMTLTMFAEHYQNVLDNPALDNHANIRAFIVSGFDGLVFDDEALELL